jgi:hypothetical protein
MCADILSEADALVDLPVALEKLEDGILASLAEGGSMLFKKLIESLLFGRDLLLKGASFSWGGGCGKILLQGVDLIELKLDDPGVEKHALRVKVLSLWVDSHKDPVQIGYELGVLFGTEELQSNFLEGLVALSVEFGRLLELPSLEQMIRIEARCKGPLLPVLACKYGLKEFFPLQVVSPSILIFPVQMCD